jgi:hypothetical protein
MQRKFVARPLALSVIKVSMLRNADQDDPLSPDDGGSPSNTIMLRIAEDERPSRLAIPPNVNTITTDAVMIVVLCSALH